MRIVSSWVGHALPLTGGTLSGALAMGGNKVTGVGAPTATNDTLNYGQAKIRNAEIATGAAIVYAKLNLTGTLLMADLATAIKNAASGLVVLDASADVPLAQIPTPLTGKDADTVDGDHLTDIQGDITTAVTNHDTTLKHPTVVIKTSDETVNNSEAMQNDNELVMTVGIDEVWLVRVILYVTSASGTPDIDWLFTVPTNGSYKGFNTLLPDNSGALQDFTSEATIALVDSTTRCCSILGIYQGGDTAGSLQLQWAQNVATVEDTKILTDSFIIAHRIA